MIAIIKSILVLSFLIFSTSSFAQGLTEDEIKLVYNWIDFNLQNNDEGLATQGETSLCAVTSVANGNQIHNKKPLDAYCRKHPDKCGGSASSGKFVSIAILGCLHQNYGGNQVAKIALCGASPDEVKKINKCKETIMKTLIGVEETLEEYGNLDFAVEKGNCNYDLLEERTNTFSETMDPISLEGFEAGQRAALESRNGDDKFNFKDFVNSVKDGETIMSLAFQVHPDWVPEGKAGRHAVAVRSIERDGDTYRVKIFDSSRDLTETLELDKDGNNKDKKHPLQTVVGGVIAKKF